MQKILITGATGFLGKEILNQIKFTNYKCLCISRNFFKDNNKISWIKSDISNLNKKIVKIKKFSPDVLIFLSWDKIPNFNSKNCIENLNKSIIFFNSISDINSIKKIIVSGSCFEYKKDGVSYENSKPFINDYFSWSKISLYNFLKIFCHNKKISLVWFRIFYMYGINQRKEALIPYIFNKLVNKKIPKIKNIYNKLDFINVYDVAKIIITAIKKRLPNGIYNLGTGKSTRIIKVYEIICKILKKKNLIKIKKNKPEINFKASKKKFNKYFSYNFIKINEGIKKSFIN
jgi:dTDP-6-deoxy-L-talose 4-dehydrogenase (NAD+)